MFSYVLSKYFQSIWRKSLEEMFSKLKEEIVSKFEEIVSKFEEKLEQQTNRGLTNLKGN